MIRWSLHSMTLLANESSGGNAGAAERGRARPPQVDREGQPYYTTDGLDKSVERRDLARPRTWVVRVRMGDHKGLPLLWYEAAAHARSSIVGAIPCGCADRATAAALHSCCHSPTKSCIEKTTRTSKTRPGRIFSSTIV